MYNLPATTTASRSRPPRAVPSGEATDRQGQPPGRPGPAANAAASEAARPRNQHTVPAYELFTPDFVSRHTRFATFDALLAAGGLVDPVAADLGPAPSGHWDDFIRTASRHPHWNALLRAASAEWLMRRLGLVIDG